MSAPPKESSQQDENRKYWDWQLDNLLGTRPTRLSKEERAEARRFYARHQRERSELLAGLAELEKSGTEITDAILEDFGLFAPPLPPATQFIREQLKGVPLEKFDSTLRQTLADLVARNIPQTSFVRGLIAAELHRASLSETQRKRYDRENKLQAELQVINDMKRYFMTVRGMTAAEADEEVVRSLDLSSVGNLNQKKYRARRRRIS
jgi:hypothetical protein